MKKTLFTATLLAASLMAASTVQAAPQEVTMWHYFDQKPEQEMLADMVEEYNSLQDDIHINATFVSRTELMNQYTVGALSGELPDIGQVDSPDMESYISLGVFEDITDDLESWGELDQLQNVEHGIWHRQMQSTEHLNMTLHFFQQATKEPLHLQSVVRTLVSAKDQKTKKHVLNSLSGSAHRKTKQNGQL